MRNTFQRERKRWVWSERVFQKRISKKSKIISRGCWNSNLIFDCWRSFARIRCTCFWSLILFLFFDWLITLEVRVNLWKSFGENLERVLKWILKVQYSVWSVILEGFRNLIVFVFSLLIHGIDACAGVHVRYLSEFDWI